MPKPADRPYSRYSLDALQLLGNLIREARINRATKAGDLAARAGISRDLLRKIEQGDPRCTIGAVFEVAAIVGVRLFDEDREALARRLGHSTEKQALLPKSVRSPLKAVVHDDF